MVALHSLVLTLALTANSDVVLLDFSADWCGPCRQMEPVVQQLSAAGYPIRKVNVDQERDLASRHQVTGIPCFVLVANGQEVDRLVGAADASQLVAMFERAGIGNREVGSRKSEVGSQGIGAAATTFPAVASQTPFSQTSFADSSRSLPQPVVDAITIRERVLASSVRLKIKDPDGNSVGSGTIIDAREGEALVLTCGHVFRDSQGKGQITVDTFGPNAAQGIPARLISYDLKSDVGLVSFRTTGPVAAARVAPAGHRPAVGDSVINVGCSHGADPTSRDGRVTALDRFLGPPNVEVSGQPVQGRSGGGLFTTDGLVIGVCNAADPSANEGLYAAIGSIHAALDRASLSLIYDAPSHSAPASAALAAITPPAMPAAMPRPEVGSRKSEVRSQISDLRSQISNPQSAVFPSTLNPQPSTLIPPPDAEVICIVRPHSDPRAKSEIIVLDRATPSFLDWLANEQRTQSGRQMTSLQVRGEGGSRKSEVGGAAEAGSASEQPASLRWLRPRTQVLGSRSVNRP
jgi:thioredoxin